MKESVLKQIYATPLSYPYFDEQALQAIEPLDIRFKVSTMEVTDKIATEYGFSKDRVPEMILAQFQAARHVAQKLKKPHGSSAYASKLSGMDNTLLSKYMKGERPFSPNAAVVTPFAYNVMEESCHKLMFGSEGRITLPSIYAEMARAMAVISEEEKKTLLRKAKMQMKRFEQQNPKEIPNAPHREISTLFRERILELTYDKGTQAYQLFGKDTPYVLRHYISQYVVEDYMRASPRMTNLLFLSFETGLALDYFIAEEFTKMVPCFYQAGDEIVELKDQTALNIIGTCAALPVEVRSTLIGEVIGAGLGVEFVN